MVEATREACPTITGLTQRLNCFRLDCSVHDGHRRYPTTAGVSCSLSVKTSTRAPPLEMSNRCGKSPPTLVCLALGLTTVSASACPLCRT